MRLANKTERENLWHTSFHGTEVSCTANELTEILGKDNIGKSGDGKSLYNWLVKFGDQYFTIYDWKEYRNFSKNEMIDWHIGSALTEKEEQIFRDALKEKLTELRSRD